MGLEELTLKQQVRALERIRDRLGFPSTRKMAKAMGVDTSTLSRCMSHENTQRMGRWVRLALAQLLGSRCEDVEELSKLLEEAGWSLTEEEWDEAEVYLRREDSLREVPLVALERYVGREEELKTVQEALLARGTAAPLILLVEGIPGIGKTTLVARIVKEKEIRKRFEGRIFWVRMEGKGEEEAWLELAEQVAKREPREQSDLKRFVRLELRRKRAIVVLDGAEKRLDLDRWMVVDPIMGRLVVTTRRTDLYSRAWEERVWRMELEVLPHNEARALLTQRVDVDVEEAAIERLLELFGGLPLALEIANRLAVMDRGFRLLVVEAEERLLDTLEIKPPLGREESVRLAFEMSYKRLGNQAKELFRFLGNFPQPFDVEPVAYVLGWKHGVVGKAFRELVRHGLVHVEGSGRYSMHRLLQEYARELVEEHDRLLIPQWEERFAQYYLDVTRGAAEMWQGGKEREAWQIWRRELRHIEWGCDCAANLGRGGWVLAYMQYTDFYLGSSGLEGLVEKWREHFESLVQDRESKAWGSLSLGEAYMLLGKPIKAVPLLQAARQVWAEEGDERKWLRITLRLVDAFMMAGQPESALALTEEEPYERIATGLPVEDSLKAEAWSIFGKVRESMGRWADARYGYLKALESIEKGAKRGWEKATLLFSLGSVLLAVEQLEEALEAFEEGMRISETVGYEYFWGLHTLQSAAVLARLGKIKEAQERLDAVRFRVGEDPRLGPVICLAEIEIAEASGAWEEAERACRAAIKGFAGTSVEVDLWVRLAELHKERKEMGLAVEAWEQARESGRKTGYWYKYLLATLGYGKYLWEEGRREEGRPLLKEVAVRGRQEGYHRLAAEALELLGMEEEAETLRGRAQTEEFLYLLPVIMAERDIPMYEAFGVEVDGEQRWVEVPGFGEGAGEHFSWLFDWGRETSEEQTDEDQEMGEQEERDDEEQRAP